MPREFQLDESQRMIMLMQVGFTLVIGTLILFLTIAFGLSPFIGLPLSGLAFLASASNYLQCQSIRLVTSSNGIAYYQLGIEIFTPWDNVERVEMVKGSLGILELQVEGLVLIKPAQQVSQSWAKWVAGWMWLTEFGKQGRLIPLGQFPRWRDSEIGQEFRKYGPRLF